MKKNILAASFAAAVVLTVLPIQGANAVPVDQDPTQQITATDQRVADGLSAETEKANFTTFNANMSAIQKIESIASSKNKDGRFISSKSVPFKTKVIEDATIPAGVELVEVKGSDGRIDTFEIYETVVGTDGKEERASITWDEMSVSPTDQVERKGTKPNISGIHQKVADKEAQLAAAKAADEAAEEQRKAEEANASSPSSLPAWSGGGDKASWMRAAGIPEDQWQYVDYIVSHESSWNPNAVNEGSGACGLGQFLPCSKVTGGAWNDPVVSLKFQKQYVEDRYGSYQGAYNFWVSNSWY